MRNVPMSRLLQNCWLEMMAPLMQSVLFNMQAINNKKFLEMIIEVLIMKMCLFLKLICTRLVLPLTTEKEKPKKGESYVLIFHEEVIPPDDGNFDMPVPPPAECGPGIPGTFAFISMELED